MTGDIRALLAAGRFQLPADEQLAQIQAYWDEVCALRQQVSCEPGPAEPAITWAPSRDEDA